MCPCRYNLMNEGVPQLWANLFAVVFPWLVALFFYAGDALANLITWSSAVLFVLLNCMLPILIWIIRIKELEEEAKLVGGGTTTTTTATRASTVVTSDALSLNDTSHSHVLLPKPHQQFALELDERHADECEEHPHSSSDENDASAGGGVGNPDIHELPAAFARCCSVKSGAYAIAAMGCVLCVATLALQIYSVATPASS